MPEADAGKKPRNDPERLKAFAQRLNVMLGELGLPERGRARLIKERVGVSGTTAANWLRGDSYTSFEELGRMSQLGVDPSRLLPDTSEAARSRASETVSRSGLSKSLTRLIDSGQVQPLAQLKTEDGSWDHTALPNTVLKQLLGRSLSGFVLLLMKGDSMGERLRDGTPLLVDTQATQIAEDNAVYALLLGDTVIVRRVQRRLQGGYLIACDNPAITPETVNNLSSHHDREMGKRDLAVLGKVAVAIQRL
jgi:transcriptional regulator with XRE-family HTH domain